MGVTVLGAASQELDALDELCLECVAQNNEAAGVECTSSLRHATRCRYWTLIEGSHNYNPGILWPPTCVPLPRTFSWDGPFGQDQGEAVMRPIDCPPTGPEPEPEPEDLALPPPAPPAPPVSNTLILIISTAAGALLVICVFLQRRRRKRRIRAEEQRAFDALEEEEEEEEKLSEEELARIAEEERIAKAAEEKRKQKEKMAMIVRGKDFKPLEDNNAKQLLLGGSGARAAITQKWAHLYPPKVEYRVQQWTRAPNPTEVAEFAPKVGLDPAADAKLLYLAEAALCAPLPAGWAQGVDGLGKVLFFTYESGGDDWTYEHPLLPHFRKLVRERQRDGGEGGLSGGAAIADAPAGEEEGGAEDPKRIEGP
eukprot:COSAG04_NODE_2818_length_3536_cov_1.466104_2_plen_368_part_00